MSSRAPCLARRIVGHNLPRPRRAGIEPPVGTEHHAVGTVGVLGKHSDLAVEPDSVNPIVGRIREVHLTAGAHCRSIGRAIPVADNLPLFTRHEHLKDVLTRPAVGVRLQGRGPVAPQPGERLRKDRSGMPRIVLAVAHS